MSAAVLRQAASLMRERAEGAMSAVGDDHWNWDVGWCDPHGTTYDVKGDVLVAAAATEEVAEYICPLRPAVALAVADWLDREATLHDSIAAVGDLLNAASKGLGAGAVRLQFSDTGDQMAASTMPQALAVATAYLGDQS